MSFTIKKFLSILLVVMIAIASGIGAVEKHDRRMPQGLGREVDIRNDADFGIFDEEPGRLY